MSRSQRVAVVGIRPAGMLGNRLFLGAYFAAHSLEAGYSFLYPALGEYAGWFEGTCGKLWCPFETPPDSVPSVEPAWLAPARERLCAILDICTGSAAAPFLRMARIRTIDLARTFDAEDTAFPLGGRAFADLLHDARIVFAKGWKFRDDDALKKFHGPVARFFRPIGSIREEVGRVMRAARCDSTKVVGVHVRQGDYRRWQGGRFFYESERYAGWMREAAHLWPGERLAFVVCSNEPQPWAVDTPGLRVVAGPGSPVADLYALAECDAIIGPPSTFSLWASYYGRTPLHMLESASQHLHPASFTLHDRA